MLNPCGIITISGLTLYKTKKVLLLLCLLLALASPALAGQAWWGEVVKVVDGDSLVVMRGRTPVEIRLAWVDAPEWNQPWGKRAKAGLREQLRGKRVQVAAQDVDRHGRVVAEVIPAGQSVNMLLLETGRAWWYERYAPGCGACREAQEQARRKGLGLWSLPNPVPPWKWRRSK